MKMEFVMRSTTFGIFFAKLTHGNSQIAQQVAVLISNIARLDYPKERYVFMIQSANVLISHHVFMSLFQTPK